jgi:hypothetical protein
MRVKNGPFGWAKKFCGYRPHRQIRRAQNFAVADARGAQEFLELRRFRAGSFAGRAKLSFQGFAPARFSTGYSTVTGRAERDFHALVAGREGNFDLRRKYVAILHGSPYEQNLSPEKFPAAWLFYRGARIKTVCFQRLVFGLPRAPIVNRRREDAPRIPLGD